MLTQRMRAVAAPSLPAVSRTSRLARMVRFGAIQRRLASVLDAP